MIYLGRAWGLAIAACRSFATQQCTIAIAVTIAICCHHRARPLGDSASGVVGGRDQKTRADKIVVEATLALVRSWAVHQRSRGVPVSDEDRHNCNGRITSLGECPFCTTSFLCGIEYRGGRHPRCRHNRRKCDTTSIGRGGIEWNFCPYPKTDSQPRCTPTVQLHPSVTARSQHHRFEP